MDRTHMFDLRKRFGTTGALFALVCVPIVTSVLLMLLAAPLLSFELSAVNKEVAERYRAAALWGTSFMAYVAAAVWNVLVAAWIIRGHLPERGRRIAYRLAFVVGAIAFFARVLYGSPGAPLSLVKASHVDVYRATAVGNAFLGATLVLFVAACGALLYREGGNELDARELRERIANTRLSMYSAAALLVVGVVEIYYLNDWPAHVFVGTDKHIRDGLHEMAYTNAVVAGAVYSVILLMLYLPVLLIHDSWVTRLAERAMENSPVDLSKWRQEHGLGRSATETVGQIVAVVGPWATALGLPKLLAIG